MRCNRPFGVFYFEQLLLLMRVVCRCHRPVTRQHDSCWALRACLIICILRSFLGQSTGHIFSAMPRMLCWLPLLCERVACPVQPLTLSALLPRVFISLHPFSSFYFRHSLPFLNSAADFAPFARLAYIKPLLTTLLADAFKRSYASFSSM